MSLPTFSRFHGRVHESNAHCEARGCEARTALRQCPICLEWLCPDHPCEHRVDMGCPNCGAVGGSPVTLGSGQTSEVTGYQDSGEGCTRCTEDDIERARR